MITRIWRGWTSRANAPVYEVLLRDDIFPGIAARATAGYRGISLGVREIGNEVEFVPIMWFDSLDDVRAFAGEAYDLAVVPPTARAVLKRIEDRSAHYETPVPPPASLSAR